MSARVTSATFRLPSAGRMILSSSRLYSAAVLRLALRLGVLGKEALGEFGDRRRLLPGDLIGGRIGAVLDHAEQPSWPRCAPSPASRASRAGRSSACAAARRGRCRRGNAGCSSWRRRAVRERRSPSARYPTAPPRRHRPGFNASTERLVILPRIAWLLCDRPISGSPPPPQVSLGIPGINLKAMRIRSATIDGIYAVEAATFRR